MDKRGGEHQDFPSKIICLTVPKIFVREPFRVSLISGIEKIYVSEGYVTIFDFLSKIFCLTVPKNFVRDSYSFWENFWFRKVLWMKRGVSRFSVENFSSHIAEKFRGHPFNVSEKLGYRNILCILCEKKFAREPFCVSENFWQGKIFMDMRGGGGGVSRFSVEKLLSHYTKIFLWRTLWCFRKIFYRKFSCIGGGGGASQFCRKF